MGYLKRLFSWQVVLGIILVALSAAFYLLHYALFRDAHHIWLYLVGDIAFVFIEVLMVTMILHQLLSMREKKNMLKKLNMVIGAFFSEAGTPLLKLLAVFDPHAHDITGQLVVRDNWSHKDFLKMYRRISGYSCTLDCARGDLEELRKFLQEKRQFLLTLLENPNLLEHETFTNLLWAVFHLTEELSSRKSFKHLPEKDYQHLANDIKRAYLQLIGEWLNYMSHLKSDYPYLFSLAMRTNPFDPQARVEIEK